ncbi:MAG: glycosyltransferase [Bacteroidetes bacterium]|nr:glycosyltransferase [Bacteroidota bacterium]MBU1113883.1 glycosyltransferase [Bacteroidota bacterium]MBU1798091.1 glycosyltransferase [Bacteroidota bacterium]
MFKVLVISYYFPPMGLSGVQRVLKFTKYMSNYNWEPTVITAGKTGYYAHDLSLQKEAEKANIKIIRTDANDPNSLLAKYGTISMPREFIRKILSMISKFVFIPDNKISWSKKAFTVAKNVLLEEKFDLIFVSIPPFSQFEIAAKLKNEFNIPLIVDYRDLWFGNHFGFYPTPYHKYKHKKLEYASLKATDKIITVNRRMKEMLLTTYPFLSFEDFDIIPHGFDPEDFINVKPINFETKKLRILYSGIFYENITPKYLLKAYKELSKERPDITENIELHFVGHFRKENKKLVKKLNLYENVIEHGYLNHSDVLRYIVSVDVLWVMLGNGTNMDMVSAGKLFEYFGTRKPIIATVPDGASKTSAENYKASFITKPDDINEIKKMLVNIFELYHKNQLPIPDEEYVIKYDRNFLTKKLVNNFQFFLRTE